MNDQTQDQLDDVLDAFVAAGPASLSEWVKRYPDYEQELTDFAASWQLSEALPISPDAQLLSDDNVVQAGMRGVRDLLRNRGFEREPAAAVVGAAASMPLHSLLEEARARGLRPRQFAAAVGLGGNVLAKLDRGLIRFASIPNELFETLAATLEREVGSIREYLEHKGPSVAPVAAYKAEQAPQVGEPEDFASAVASDASMTTEQRQHWLESASRSDR